MPDTTMVQIISGALVAGALLWLFFAIFRKKSSIEDTYSYDQKTEYSKLPPDIFIILLENGKLQVSWNVFENVTHYLVYVNGIFSQTVHTNKCEIEPHESGKTRIGVCPVFTSGEQGEMGSGWITRSMSPIKETLVEEPVVQGSTVDADEVREVPPTKGEKPLVLGESIVATPIKPSADFEAAHVSRSYSLDVTELPVKTKKATYQVDYPGQAKGFTKGDLRAIHKQVKKGISIAAVAREWQTSRDTVKRMMEFVETENASKKVVKS